VKIAICSITKKKIKEETILYKSLHKNKDVYLFIKTNNTTVGLSEYFNSCLEEFKDYDILTFIHDDVHIVNSDLHEQLKKAHQNYDVVGVAGCISPKIIEQNLWHWMAGNQKNCRGMAGHPVSSDSLYVTSFGPTPSRVVIIDGVLMSLNVKKILKANVKFDESFTFHHYDIDFCLTCNKNGIKIGVWPILINHSSPGLKEFNDVWNESNKIIIKKWKNK
jgi:GT2 family glycosyltransferase